MGRKGKIVGIILFTILFLAVWNLIIVPAMQAPLKKDMAICDQKTQLLDQAAIALDHNDQAKYDQLQAQVDSIKGCG